jgi:hypothetical protein
MEGMEGMEGIEGMLGMDGSESAGSRRLGSDTCELVQSQLKFQFQIQIVGCAAAGPPGGAAVGEPDCGCAAAGAEPSPPALTFCCSAGPSLPGLNTRTVMFVFDWPGTGDPPPAPDPSGGWEVVGTGAAVSPP